MPCPGQHRPDDEAAAPSDSIGIKGANQGAVFEDTVVIDTDGHKDQVALTVRIKLGHHVLEQA